MSESRDISRDMHRVASLYNGVVFEQLRAITWEYLVDHYLTAEDKLCLDVQICWRPIEQTPLFGDQVPEDIRRTVVSVNSCITAIDFNTAWLAFCVEDLKFEIKEVTFYDPKPVRSVELWVVGDNVPTRTDYAHTVFKFTPEDGGEEVVADATYAQYSFDGGIDTYNAYRASKICANDSYRIRERPIGCAFKDFAESEGHNWEKDLARAVICTTSNVMVRELNAVGGIQALLDMTAEDFQKVRDTLLAVVKQEMEALRCRFEAIFYARSDVALMEFADFAADCDGPSHRACMQSLLGSKDRVP